MNQTRPLCTVIVSGIFCCLLGASSSAHGSKDAKPREVTPLTQLNVRNWSTLNGLPNSKITAILQSSDGYLWFGTQGGLARFDGARFEVFDRKSAPALPNSEISSLLEDKDSTLWIGTVRGVAKYRSGKFLEVPVETGFEPFVCTRLLLDRRGHILVGSRSGLFEVRNDSIIPLSGASKLSGNYVTSFAEDDDGMVYIGSHQGLWQLSGTTLRRLRLGNIRVGVNINSVLIDGGGTMWLGTSEGLFLARGLRSQRLDELEEHSGRNVQTLLMDREGCVWIGTEKHGCYRDVGGRSDRISLWMGVTADYIISLLQDREGSVWIGSFTSGVYQLWKAKVRTVTPAQGLGASFVRAVFEDKDGSVWLGTEAGLSRWREGKVRNYTEVDGLIQNQVRAIFQDREGALWLGARKGVSRFDGTRFRNFAKQEGTSDEYARAISEDFEGNVLIGYATQGMDRYRAGAFTNMEHEGIPRCGIRVIYRGSNRTLWIGTDRGLLRWRDGKGRMYTSQDGLTHDVFAVHEDTDGVIWLGSYGDGLYRLQNDRISRITTQHGLYDDVVYQILEDDSHNLWLSCNNGISRVSRHELNDFAEGKVTRVTSIGYGASDGMLSAECNGNTQPAGIRTRSGYLWFPTTNGAVIIDPSDIPMNTTRPQAVVEAFRIDGVDVGLGVKPTVGSGYNYLEVHYTGLSFVVPERVIFQYKLEGFDREWKEAQGRRVAYYTNIPPGEYVFRVRARNYDGYWSERDATLGFALKPAFFQTLWFYAILTGAIVASAFLLYRWRLAYLLRREKELQRRVDEALAEVKVLGGLIPICSHCKKIRDDSGYWNQLEKYLKEHSEATFTHGICPDCLTEHYGQLPRREK